MTDVLDWRDALDRLEQALDCAWMAIGREDLDTAIASIDALEPAYLTDLPPSLAGRAQELVRRLDDLITVLAASQHDVERELAVASRMTTADTTHPRFIDQRA